tara:strand:+ start:1348 stop:2064 length:717 start_codon:yes stop_codon:yes gene_type:complete
MNLQKLLGINNVVSQNGEDGILEGLFEDLEIKNGYGVELGAWDGKLYSNLYALIQRGWSALLIEGDETKVNAQKNNLQKWWDKIESHSGFVSCEPEEKLDDIFDMYNTPTDFDFLSLDIDGNDYWVWDSLKKYTPKVVLIEYNNRFDEPVTITYDPNFRFHQTQYFGGSAPAMEKLAKQKGYELVGMTICNMIFVRKELNNGKFKTFSVEDQSFFSNWYSPRGSRPLPTEELKMLVKV